MSDGVYQYRYKLHNGTWAMWHTCENREDRDAAVLHWFHHHPDTPAQTRDFALVHVSGVLSQGDLFAPGEDEEWAGDESAPVADQIHQTGYFLRMASPAWAGRTIKCADRVDALVAAAEQVLLAQHRTNLDALASALVPFRAKETT